MSRRRPGRIAAIGVVALAAALALSLWVAGRVRDARAARALSSLLLQPREGPTGAGTGADAGIAGADFKGADDGALVSVSAPLADCEARIEHQAPRLPVVAIVGASYTAGTGPDNQELSWAVKLALQLRWNAVIYGVPGAGYVRTGASGRGPVTRMLDAERLRELGPSLVLVQAGHNDLGASTALERHRVGAAVDLVRAAAPRARIGLVTTFAFSPGGSPGLRQVDQAIIAGATAADPGVVIMDPLAGRWAFPRAADGLHPTAAGHAWLARRVATELRAHGVAPAAPGISVRPVICDATVGVRHPAAAGRRG